MLVYGCTKCGARTHQAIDCSYAGPPTDDLKSLLLEIEEVKKQRATSPPPVTNTPYPGSTPPVKTNDATGFEKAPPRFKGCPPICLRENLPAFPDKAAMYAFMKVNASSSVREWQCKGCGCWHYEAKPHSPGGQTSGTERAPYHNHPPNWDPTIRNARMNAAFVKQHKEEGPDLPQQAKPVKPAAPKKKLEPKPVRGNPKKDDGWLF